MSLGTTIGLGCINALSHLPLSVHYFFSDVLLYPLVHYVVRYRVKVVRKNLSKAFPEKTQTEKREIENRFYHYFCDLAVEIIKFHSMPAEELKKRVRYFNIEYLHQLAEDHDFLCCYLSHYGNWEWLVGLPFFFGNIGMCQIYHPLKNKAFDQWFIDNRSRFGAVNIPMKQTVRRLLGLRQEMQAPDSKFKSYAFGCIADQLPKAENVHHRIQFMSQDTAVFTGSETLAQKFNMAYVYCKMTRPKRGYYEFEFQPMTGTSEATSAADINPSEFPYTDEYFHRFEADLRERPELWLWTHDRWKR